MSVALFRFDGDIYDQNSECSLCVPISSEKFYLEYWDKAIKEMGVRYIQDGAEFDKSNLDIILKELVMLKNWAIEHLSGVDLQYMKERVEQLQEVIPQAFIDKHTILYIF